MRLQMDTVVVRKSGLMGTVVDRDIIILNMARNTYVGLDPVGRRIWDLIETPHRIAELAHRLGEEFDGEAEDIVQDIMSFLGELEAEGLIDVEKG